MLLSTFVPSFEIPSTPPRQLVANSPSSVRSWKRDRKKRSPRGSGVNAVVSTATEVLFVLRMSLYALRKSSCDESTSGIVATTALFMVAFGCLPGVGSNGLIGYCGIR
ncbi:hypothetical protein HBI80_216950 [Parastagonospora nodorum]|nr:hypothetical protein HBH91_082790 [Parastagonospora nodorum]KAH4895603.1 hypothetical protein HBI80_216950 [Parastagonospora nodorum]KAH5464938.1 hypothetical protein HBI31_203800 [Parastagonospora nodorum]KAH5987807.1 hypothetical protein HBI84_199980 [Parastagonospora nodorum]KAH6148027.1 hypothetical protein HBI68_195880 [Parastagonospora nodorum]